ncbi:hypothetical protein FJZ18_04440 [Candidatus Pacearchaeota archaeon]|nr:hypothetical protein [Candidatus Pacearchaeota archaeon]
MKLKKIHWIGIVFGIILFVVALIFFRGDTDRNLFIFVLGLAFTAIALPFILDIMLENKRDQEIGEMFLEFSRNLAESVVTGTPVSKSIINMKSKNYGPLTPYIVKLGNQIALGIPVNKALQTFAYEVDNPIITRAVTLISEAEKAGGDIDYILDSAAKSIAEVEKLKKERKAGISTLVVQGYIIFFIFIGIMMVMEYKILPLTSGISQLGGFNINIQNLKNVELKQVGDDKKQAQDLAAPFLYLLMSQGFCAGLVIGKLSEGTIKAGLKHSFILCIAALLITTGVRVATGS